MVLRSDGWHAVKAVRRPLCEIWTRLSWRYHIAVELRSDSGDIREKGEGGIWEMHNRKRDGRPASREWPGHEWYRLMESHRCLFETDMPIIHDCIGSYL
jgi:hypothetical protein